MTARSLNTLLTSNFNTSPNGYTGSTGYTGSAGSTAAGGSNSQIQFNNSSALAGSSYLTWSTLTNTLTVSAITLQGVLKEAIYAISDGGSVDINPENGTIQTWTLGASRTPTAASFAAGQSVTLIITGGAYAITWSGLPVTWIGGFAPTLSTTGVTVVELWKVGSTIYGALVGIT